jgi:hypothetical protein
LLNLLPQLHSLSVSIRFGRTPPLSRIPHNSRVFDFSRFNRSNRRRDADSHTFSGYDEGGCRDIGIRNGNWPSAAEPAKINILAAGYQSLERVEGLVKRMCRRPPVAPYQANIWSRLLAEKSPDPIPAKCNVIAVFYSGKSSVAQTWWP